MRRARDWALSESERLGHGGRGKEERASGRGGDAVQAAAFAVVAEVLDEILEPGPRSG